MRLRDRAFVALYLASYKLPILFCMALKAADIAIRSAVIGSWLGFLSPRGLAHLDHWYYTRGAAMYLDPKYNRSGWFDWEEPVIDRHFTSLKNVLIAAGAGAGREMLALNRIGIDSVGYEYNPSLVKFGNRLLAEDGYKPAIRLAPPGAIPTDAGVYDGIIVGWASYSLMAGRAERVEFLKQVRSHCPAGAPLLISFLDRTGDGTFYKLSTKIANLIRSALKRPKVELGDTLSISFTHRFTEEELRREMIEAGFHPVLSAITPYGHAVGSASAANVASEGANHPSVESKTAG